LKMNEFQAAMGLCNLPLLKSEIDKRKKIANYYISELKNIEGLTLPNYISDIDYNYIYFPVLINHPTHTRDYVFDVLKDKEINTKKYFYPLVTDYQCYKWKYNDNLPTSNDIAQKVLCLPLYGELDSEKIMYIIEALKNALE